jgi:thymidylate kinase
MKILILEGIATSGKSTLTESIKEKLKGQVVLVATEEKTHLPIMRQTNELHVPFFEQLIKQLIFEKPGLIIFDRLYLTQAFRAGVNLSSYVALENLLAKYSTLAVFLKVDEQTIAERVAKAAEHRDPSWAEYIKTKGSTKNEIAQYYISQQRNQIELLRTSKLSHMVCDTTQHNYSDITQQILRKLELE